MKNKILYFLILINSILHAQSNWTLYPAKDSTTKIDSLTMVNAVSLILDSANEIHEDTLLKKNLIEYIKKKGHIVVNADYRLDSINSYLANRGNYNGYTVQLIVTQDTKKIRELRKTFTALFPDEFLFDEYIAPNIFLYAGKYFSENDAVILKNKLSAHFKNTMVVRKKFPLKHIQIEE